MYINNVKQQRATRNQQQTKTWETNQANNYYTQYTKQNTNDVQTQHTNENNQHDINNKTRAIKPSTQTSIQHNIQT